MSSPSSLACAPPFFRPSSIILSLGQSIKKMLPGHSHPKPSNKQPNPSKLSLSSTLKFADDNTSIASEDTIFGQEIAKDEGKADGNAEWEQKLKDRLPKDYDAKKAVDWESRTRFYISPY